MAGRPIKKRTCASPVSFRALPENEIPHATRVDIYFSIALKPMVLILEDYIDKAQRQFSQ